MTADIMGLDGEKDQKLVGYYGGLIISSYYLAQLVCSPIWGALSDRLGRKPILLTGLLATTITCLTFGFTRWLFMAIIIHPFYWIIKWKCWNCKNLSSRNYRSYKSTKSF